MQNIFNFLAGAGTIITGVLMVASGLTDSYIIDLNWVDAGEGGKWVMEGLGLIFLRRAIANFGK